MLKSVISHTFHSRTVAGRGSDVSREEQIQQVLGVLAGESFAVFAFAGGGDAAPYTNVMFFAETPGAQLVFATSPGPLKGRYLRQDNGCCAQIDTRGVGLEQMSSFARVALQGRLQRVSAAGELEEHRALYARKLPQAAVLAGRPGIEIWRVVPSRIVFARGFAEHFELDFPEGAGSE